MSTSSARFGIAATAASTPSRSARARKRSALSLAVERREQVRRRERERVGRSVGGLDEREPALGQRAEQRQQVARPRAGQVGVDDQHRPGLDAPQRAFDRLSLAARLVGHDDRADRLRGREHVLEHRLRESRRTSSGAGASRCFAVSPRKGTTTVGMPSRDYPAVQGSPPDNAEIACAARPVRLAARAGGRRAVHGAGLPPRGRPDPLDAGAGRRARAAGPRPRAARDRAGDRAAAASSSSRPARSPSCKSSSARSRRSSPGSGASSASRSSGCSRSDACSASARSRSCARRPRPGACRRCRGSGPRPSASCARRWRRSRSPQRRQPLLLHRSRPLVESIAEALGGIAAGDPRRWRDASERLAVVVAGRPSRCWSGFEALPQIVAVVERGDRRALGVTVEGVPVELVVAEPARLGHRARPRDRLAGVGRRARAAARRARRGGRLRRARPPVRPARAARGRRAAR